MSEKMPSYVPSPDEIKKAEETMTDKQKRWSENREREVEMDKLLNVDSMEGENVAWGETIENVTWDEAVAKAKELGLRLPTLRELVFAKDNHIDGFKEGYYWSSTDFGKDWDGREQVWSVYFNPRGTFGFTAAGNDYKTAHTNVARLVSTKEINIED